jgi:hypothetical protein
MKGLPLMLSGWNGVYERTNEMSEGAPVYYRPPHRMLIFLQIFGVKLRRYGGRWVLHPDNSGLGGIVKTRDGHDSPLGHYEANGFTMVDYPDLEAQVVEYRGLRTRLFG